MEKEEVRYLEPIIIEKNIWNLNNFFLSFIIGVFIIISFFITINFFPLSLTNVLILFVFIIVLYSIILFFLLEPKKLKEVNQPVEIIKNKIIKEPVTQTVYKQIPYEVEKRIYITNPRHNKEKLNFYGSIKSGTYHKGSCRLSKLIKNDYKIGNNYEKYFIKNKYKPCKICIQNKYPSLR